jgi:hypothetical protein
MEGSNLLREIYEQFTEKFDEFTRNCRVVSFFENQDSHAIEVCSISSWLDNVVEIL